MARQAIIDIKIGGSPVSPISRLTLTQRLNGHHEFELRCRLEKQERTLEKICTQYLNKDIEINFSSEKFISKKSILAKLNSSGPGAKKPDLWQIGSKAADLTKLDSETFNPAASGLGKFGAQASGHQEFLSQKSNIAKHIPGELDPRRLKPEKPDSKAFVPGEFDPKALVPGELDPNALVPGKFDPKAFVPGEFDPRQLIPGRVDSGELDFERHVPAGFEPDRLSGLKPGLEKIGSGALNFNSSNPKKITPDEPDAEGADSLKSMRNSFHGIVTSIRLAKQASGVHEVIYAGHSPTCLLADGPDCRSFQDKSLSDIVKATLQRYKLEAKSTINPRGTDTISYFVQYKENTFHFLHRLAALYGEWFYYDGSQFLFGQPKQREPLELKFGHDVRSIHLALQLGPTRFNRLGYNNLSHQPSAGSSAAMELGDLGEYSDLVLKPSEETFQFEPTMPDYHSIGTQTDLNKLVQYQRHAQSRQMVVLQGVSDCPDVKIGTTIKLSGWLANDGKESDYGQFLITNIVHTVNGVGYYESKFEAIPASVETPPPYPYLDNPLAELQPAEVLDNYDPDGLGRVVVQCCWQKPREEKTPLIRVTSPHAGGSHGSFFIPEIGDQVLVGFEQHNPNQPYVIGSLYHAKARPQGVTDPDKLNNKKVIRTKSGNQIFFSDKKGEEEIRIQNGCNVLVMSLSKDNKITITTKGNLELSGKTILLSSQEDIKIKAGRHLIMTAPKNLSIAAGPEKTADQTTKLSLSSDGDFTSHSKGKTEVKADQSLNINAKQHLNMNADKSLNMSAKDGAALKVEGSSVNVSKGEIKVQSPMIKLN